MIIHKLALPQRNNNHNKEALEVLQDKDQLDHHSVEDQDKDLLAQLDHHLEDARDKDPQVSSIKVLFNPFSTR